MATAVLEIVSPHEGDTVGPVQCPFCVQLMYVTSESHVAHGYTIRIIGAGAK